VSRKPSNQHASSKTPNTIASRYNSDVTKLTKPVQSRLVTRDTDIRKVLLLDLQQTYHDESHDLIVEEFGCNSARTDVAVINGALHAFEIKSDSDSLDRLPSQMEAYEGVFEYITLVCGRRLFDRARLAVPKWWGLQKAEHKDGRVVLRQLRAPKMNPNRDALSLARMLWKTEALACLRKHGHKVVTSKHSADEVCHAVARCIPVSLLSDEVRSAIKIRGGSGFAKQSAPNDDSCTIESTVQESHLPDLSWLLSQRYQSRLD
jgi:hypothetical protein